MDSENNWIYVLHATIFPSEKNYQLSYYQNRLDRYKLFIDFAVIYFFVQVENIHTTGELKMTGNCLKGSRPLLSFDKTFEKVPQFKLMKELFVQIFGIPNHHPKSQPFFDKVFTFTVVDGKVSYSYSC